MYSLEISEIFNWEIRNTMFYIEENWGKRSAEKFYKALKSQMETIRSKPFLYAINLNDIRKCKVLKHNFIFYKVSENKVQIIMLWNHYRDPKYLEQILAAY